MLKNKIFLSTITTMALSFVYAQEKNDSIAKIEIDEVVVTGSGYRQNVKDAPATISVIPQSEIKKRAYRDITDVLQDIPGVFITGGGGSSDISIRGADAGYTLILIDGKRANTRAIRPNSDGPGLEQGLMPPIEAIERIEVVKGPMSTLYGSDAMGGVINIITKKTSDIEWRGSLATDAMITTNSDAGNTYQVNANASGSLIKNILGLKINGLYSHRDEDKIVGGFPERAIKSIGGQLSYNPNENNTITADFNYNRQERYSRIGKSLAAGGRSSTSFDNYDRINYALGHQGKYGRLRLNNTLQHDKSDNFSRGMKYKTTILNSINTYDFNKHVLSFGGEFRNEKLNDPENQFENNGIILNEIKRYQWALFAEMNWKILKKLNFVTGIRYDNNENYGSHIAPRGYLIYSINNNFTLKGGVASGYKAPSLRQSTDNWGSITGGANAPIPGVILGDSNLKPEKSFNQELTIMFEDNKKVISASITGYHTNFDDKITEVRVCDNCQYNGVDYLFVSRQTNVDKSVIRGLESNLAIRLSNDINLKTNYTFTESEVRTGNLKGKSLSRLPKHMANAILEWKVIKELDLWSRYNFRSKSLPGISRGNAATTTISDYSLFDLGGVYRFTKNFQFNLGVYNIFNRQVYNSTGATEFRIDGTRYQIGATFRF
ncbi:TonB-dependent receptor domain-containing protein [Chishuiella sp.]|uniref:TonB-dependent receptor domain-containing protein n=1 Tax=Chishuiella sp. TaxID=1969467 RepID=UPI0028A5D938|nr:TonB-dependent receptor [Chishuiella sp.]